MGTEPGDRHLPGCLIISGMPGAGKSTVSRLIAVSLPRAARLDGDDMAEMITSGRVGFREEPADEARRQLLLRARNLCSLADNFACAGFTPVVDHVVGDRQVLTLVLDHLQVRPVLLAVLAPPLEVCRHRNATRDPDQRIDYDIAPFYATMRSALHDVGWWLDTSGLTPQQTARTILAGAAEHAVVAS